jgi:hypothetical protein
MLTSEKLERLKMASRINKITYHKRKGGDGYEKVGTVVDEVYIIVADYKHMIQKIQFPDDAKWGGNDFAYRAGYYTYEANGKNIKWGQYTPVLTESQYRELLGKAKEKGWNIF